MLNEFSPESCKDDLPYREWCDQNLDGFVLNTPLAKIKRVRKITSATCLHKADCHTVRGEELDAGAYTQNAYMKITSLSSDEIDLLCFNLFGAAPKRCSKCNPPALSLLSNEHDIELDGAKEAVRVQSLVSRYKRNPAIATFAKNMGDGKCQLCQVEHPQKYEFFDAHHIDFLRHGGYDNESNVISLCPNCHRDQHIRPDVHKVTKMKEIAFSLVSKFRRNEVHVHA